MGEHLEQGERRITGAMLTDTWRQVRILQEQIAMLSGWWPSNRHLENITDNLSAFAESLHIAESETTKRSRV